MLSLFHVNTGVKERNHDYIGGRDLDGITGFIRHREVLEDLTQFDTL